MDVKGGVMKIRLLVSRVGQDERGRGINQKAGDIIDVSEREAIALFDAGLAERISKVVRKHEWLGEGEAQRLAALGEVEILETVEPSVTGRVEARVISPIKNAARRVGRLSGLSK
jgi:hypothetical protein